MTILVSLFIQFYASTMYSSLASTVGAVVGIVVFGVIIDWLTRARVQRQAELLEFEG